MRTVFHSRHAMPVMEQCGVHTAWNYLDTVARNSKVRCQVTRTGFGNGHEGCCRRCALGKVWRRRTFNVAAVRGKGKREAELGGQDSCDGGRLGREVSMQKFRPELFQSSREVRGTVNGEFIQSRPCDELMTQPLGGRRYRKKANFDSSPAKLDQFSGDKSFGQLRKGLDDVGDTARCHGRSESAK